MFTNTPNNYASLWGDLIFEYTSSSAEDVEFEVYDDVADEKIGVKKFYSVTSSKINIAPMLFDLMLPAPDVSPTTASMRPQTGFPRVRVAVGTEESEPLTFTYAKEDLGEQIVLRTMPRNRILYRGEGDQITLIGTEGGNISFQIGAMAEGDSSYTVISTLYTSIDGGVRTLYLYAGDYVDDYVALRVVVISDGETLETLYYSLVDQEQVGYRVAWISEKGTVEHYTFPVESSTSRLSSGAVRRELRSAYGTSEQIEALSQIVSSPALWHVEALSYTPIRVETDEQSIRNEGVLSIINIKILENG